MDARARYLELLKTVLDRGGELDRTTVHATNWKRHIIDPAQRALARYGLRLSRITDSQRETLLSRTRLDNIQDCIERTLAEEVPGDLMEVGVYRGGGVIFMRAVLAAYEVTNRTVWAADSFVGFPASQVPEDRGVDYTGGLGTAFFNVGLDRVKQNFMRFGLLDDQVRFLVGWFEDTLPRAPVEQLALLRLDADMYKSTLDALNALEAKVAPGGYVIVDDYGAFAACRQAIDEYRARHNVTEPLIPVDNRCVYWRKRLP